MRRYGLCLLLPAATLLQLVACAGCWNSGSSEVVVYTALDREFSEPILDDVAEEAGLRVLSKFDIESTKTVGLVTAIMQEGNRPRCDVFWNNEILHTLRLKKKGLLRSFELPSAAKFPAEYRSPEGAWYGFAARARVLLVNRDLVPKDRRPNSIHDLTDPVWQGRVGIAKPLFGTTATHAAVLFSLWGTDQAQDYYRRTKEYAKVLAGNKQVAIAVGRGQLAFGITDTDDAIIELERGYPVDIIYPDQASGQMGTLFIPNTVCLIKGSQNPKNAERLLEKILSAEVEKRLARSASAQFPLHTDVQELPRVHQPGVRWLDVDFEAAAERWDEASVFLRELFAQG